MSASRLALLAAAAGLASSVIACSAVASSSQPPAEGAAVPSATVVPTVSHTPAVSPSATGSQAMASPTPVKPSPSLTPSSSPTTSPVSVTASGGNLTIRRGPGLAYNSVGFLLSGVSVPASGKSADGGWLYVENPDKPGELGWVSASSRYLSASGDPAGLALVSADPAEPAFLRNCTFHPMKILPGEVILREQFDAPKNRLQMNPGTYEAYDMNQEGNPRVLTVELREGHTKDIVTDGLGNTYSCP